MYIISSKFKIKVTFHYKTNGMLKQRSVTIIFNRNNNQNQKKIVQNTLFTVLFIKKKLKIFFRKTSFDNCYISLLQYISNYNVLIDRGTN